MGHSPNKVNWKPEKLNIRKEMKPLQKLIKLDWVLNSWFDKLVYIIGILALIYSIIRIVAQGFW